VSPHAANINAADKAVTPEKVVQKVERMAMLRRL